MLFEIGPGKVLSGLARVNNFRKESRVLTINKLDDINLLLKDMNQPQSTQVCESADYIS